MRILVFLILVWSQVARAQTVPSCLPAILSAQITVLVDTEQVQRFTFPLESENASGRFQTKAVMDANYDANTHLLTFTTHFDDSFKGVSLPFNLFSVLVIEAGEVVQWQDLTGQCKGPGLGFFPGAHIQLPGVKLNGRGPESLQIMVWGRL